MGNLTGLVQNVLRSILGMLSTLPPVKYATLCVMFSCGPSVYGLFILKHKFSKEVIFLELLLLKVQLREHIVL